MTRPGHILTASERQRLAACRRRLDAAVTALVETITFGATATEVRLAAAAVSHEVRRLHAALDAIERADDGGAPGEQEG